MSYDHKEFEPKWQKRWQEQKLYAAEDFSKKEKFYVLVEFPYPSGDGLHVGHCRSYTALDIVARKKRMEGKNVLFPIGFDAFGLPTENYAIKNKIHPRVATDKNIANFTKQLKSIGFSFDWDRVVDTTDPKYYRWTQWIFLQFYKAGLAYQDEIAINWCPACKIGLANEEVVSGNCERCGKKVEKKVKKQWMLAITKYAQRLLDDLDTVDYLLRIKLQQQNWIGRSEGAEVQFPVFSDQFSVSVFTTRPDTLFGCTFLVLSPEHKLVQKLKEQIENWDEVKSYIDQAGKKSDMERTELAKEKTGVELKGVKAINPVNNEEIPIFVADYVLANYGTGAIMAVPAHDERDFEFATKFGIPIKPVVGNPKDYSCVENNLPLLKQVLGFCEKEKIFCVVLGGYAKDAQLGKLNKTHSDIDIAVEKNDFTKVVDFLETLDLQKEKAEDKTIGWKNMQSLFDKKKPRWIDVFAFEKKNEEVVDNFWEEEFNWGKHKEIFEVKELAGIKMSVLKKDIAEKVEKNLIKRDYKIECFAGDGTAINSGEFDGLPTAEFKKKIIEWLEKKGIGKREINFKLRDWVFSRQRYWGEPIPIVHCKKCGTIPVPEKELPLELPHVESYEPTDTGDSPLAAITDWVNTKCPKCGGPAKRETDTMPNWAGSSWYFLRYIDPENDKTFADAKKLQYWLPIDLYNGGMEHTVLHLLYSRFWHKFLYDQKLVPTPEPYARRISHGMILGPDNEKMSKSRGNVINPDEIVEKFGADTLRIYEMFIGPFDQAAPWSEEGVLGVARFLDKVERLSKKELIDCVDDNCPAEIPDTFKRTLHKTVKKITEDIDSRRFNTAVSTFMIFVNEASALPRLPKAALEKFLTLLAPFAPHLAEELWEKLGHSESIHKENWPTFDPALAKDEEIELVLQINGKIRDTVKVSADINKEDAISLAKSSEKIQKWLEGKAPKKEIFVPGKLVNLVV